MVVGAVSIMVDVDVATDDVEVRAETVVITGRLSMQDQHSIWSPSRFWAHPAVQLALKASWNAQLYVTLLLSCVSVAQKDSIYSVVLTLVCPIHRKDLTLPVSRACEHRCTVRD